MTASSFFILHITKAIDNIYKFTGYGGGLGHPMVKRSDLFKWDQIMVNEFLDKFTKEVTKIIIS